VFNFFKNPDPQKTCPNVIQFEIRLMIKDSDTQMDCITDIDFVGQTLYVSTNSKQVKNGLIPVCIHIVKNKKELNSLLEELELKGETVASMQWGV
jgi:hypothetical protein